MGKVISPFQIRGRFNDLIISGGPNGTQRAYIRTPHNRRKWLRDNPDSAANLNVVAFSAAAKVAAAIIRILPDELETRPYAHNHLNARMRPHIRHNWNKGESHLPVEKAIHAIIGAELGHHTAPGNHIRTTPIGPHHRPDALHFHGLHKAAHQLAPGGAKGLQCRLSIYRLTVPTAYLQGHNTHLRRDVDIHAKHTTEWFPAELIPDSGIRMDMPQVPQQRIDRNTPENRAILLATPTIVLVAVEWRRMRKRARPLNLKTSTTVRITGLHIPDQSPEKQALLGPDTTLALAIQARPTRRYRLQKPTRRRAEAHEATRPHTRTHTQTPQKLLEKAIGTRQRT